MCSPILSKLHQPAKSMQLECLQHPESCFLVLILLQQKQTSLTFLYFGYFFAASPTALTVNWPYWNANTPLSDSHSPLWLNNTVYYFVTLISLFSLAHRYTLWSRSTIPLERLELALHAGTCSPYPSLALQRLILGVDNQALHLPCCHRAPFCPSLSLSLQTGDTKRTVLTTPYPPLLLSPYLPPAPLRLFRTENRRD